ncbi:uncharacterized protein TNCV_1249861 [Trichonephila clavipes]|nr:uncharacterized protein TNCV_1249861 [Trichonephila clavipes]
MLVLKLYFFYLVACRRSTKSVCKVTTSRYANSLRMPHRQKNGMRVGDHGGHRTGSPSQIQRPVYSISNQSRTEAQKCAITSS